MPPKTASEKHAYDVFVIVAMLTEPELARAEELVRGFRTHPTAIAIRGEAEELFGTIRSPGSLTAWEQRGGPPDAETFALFDDGLRRALGI